MKQFLLIIILSLTVIAAADAQEIPQIGNVLNRDRISLNGDWNYIVDVQEEGYYDYRMNPTPWGFFRNAKPQRPEDLVEYDFDKAATMQIPSDWNTKDDRLFFYEGTVWFKKSFNYTKKPGKRAILYFGAVNMRRLLTSTPKSSASTRADSRRSIMTLPTSSRTAKTL